LIAKSSGANYSVHKEVASAKFSAEPAGPVKSAYQNSYKAEGHDAVHQRDAFWHNQDVSLCVLFHVESLVFYRGPCRDVA
jgi:hypothetical protein